MGNTGRLIAESDMHLRCFFAGSNSSPCDQTIPDKDVQLNLQHTRSKMHITHIHAPVNDIKVDEGVSLLTTRSDRMC